MFAADEEFVYSKALYMSAPRVVDLEERQRAILRGTWEILIKVRESVCACENPHC